MKTGEINKIKYSSFITRNSGLLLIPCTICMDNVLISML